MRARSRTCARLRRERIRLDAHETQFHSSTFALGVPMDSVTVLALHVGMIGGIAWLVKRRRGANEWIQTALVFTLSFLLVLGM